MTWIKAVQDGDNWILEVKGVPFGDALNRDSDGEYFSPQTKLHEDKYPLPPAVYYHGLEPDGSPAGKPAYIGKTTAYEDRQDGRWYTVILDKASDLAARVWEAAKQGIARASSGSISHLVRTSADGHILEWPVAELSIFDIGEGRAPANPYAVALPVMKAIYQEAGIDWPTDTSIQGEGEGGEPQAAPDMEEETNPTKHEDKTTMTDKEKAPEQVDINATVQEAVKAALDAAEAAHKAEVARLEEIENAKKEAVDAAKADWEAKAAANNRLPWGEAPAVHQYAELGKFDHLTPGELALGIHAMEQAEKIGRGRRPSEAAYQALAFKTVEAAPDDPVGQVGRQAMKAARVGGYDGKDPKSFKANEVNYSTLASFGNDWAGVLYSQDLWESIRHDTVVAGMLPSIEVPQGSESIVIPLESTDPVFYKVAQVTGDAATGGLSRPSPTVTSSRLGTSSQTLTVSKMGARTRYSGELEEDSVVMWAPQLMNQLQRAGAEQLEAAIIDGDTETAATTNVSDIGGTPAATDLILMFNGFRKLPLVTNTANSRSGGALTEDDYLDTIKLLGAAGKAGADPTKVAFIVDPNVYWKSLQLSTVKTQDVWQSPTLEGGRLTGIWGYPLFRSYSMHWGTRAASGYEYKANTAGKLDLDTDSNNTTGSILAVRWDQWLLGYKRRMTIETTRVPYADYTEIVALMRVGLINRDTDASAITYNVSV